MALTVFALTRELAAKGPRRVPFFTRLSSNLTFCSEFDIGRDAFSVGLSISIESSNLR